MDSIDFLLYPLLSLTVQGFHRFQNDRSNNVRNLVLLVHYYVNLFLSLSMCDIPNSITTT